MALNLLFGVKEPGKIGNLTLDATLNEGHSYSNTITKFPVEDGSDISDHVKRDPEKVSIEGLITNSPVQFLGGVFSGDRVKEGFEELLKIAGYDYPDQADSPTSAKNNFVLVTIVTGLRIYSEMGMTRLTIPRNSKTGDAIKFSAEFIKVRFTTSQFTQVQNTSELDGRAPGIVDQASSTADVGTQVAEEVSTSRLKATAGKVLSLVSEGI